MEFQIGVPANNVVVIALSDRFDGFRAPALREQLQQLLDGGTTRFVLDLSDITFLDSAGMAVLVSLLKKARQVGGDVRLVEPKLEAVKRILKLTRLDLVFAMTQTSDDALRSF